MLTFADSNKKFTMRDLRNFYKCLNNTIGLISIVYTF